MNNTPLTDKEVIKILSGRCEEAYKYGTLKPKIDNLMKALIDKLEKEYLLKLEVIKKDLITIITEIK